MTPSGNGHIETLQLEKPPRRVVSLVPSLTESLFDLGFGEVVVGITEYCVYPAEQVSKLPRVGGTKNPRLEEILALAPDLVLANREENPRQIVEALQAANIPVWVTFPTTVRAALDILWLLVGLFHNRTAASKLETLEIALGWAQNAFSDSRPLRYFCPIWFDETSDGLPWWMTFNHETYTHDLLRIFGGWNIFADRQRRYPLEADLGLQDPQDPAGKDTRYPRVGLNELQKANPEIILLPSEPYSFEAKHETQIRDLLLDSLAVRHNRIVPVDGSLLTWHGTRLGRALQELPALLAGE